jgi:3-oxoacyl-[acyl-carrier protein] reductase
VPPSFRLDGQIALVTGAGRGIGAEAAVALAGAGAEVILLSRTKADLDAVAQRITEQKGHATTIVCDVNDGPRVRTEIEKLHRLDILVNNAGISIKNGPLHQLAPETWEQVMNTNLRGAYYCIRALAPLMINAGSGHIINISSLAGKNALPNGAAYAASKWGLNGLTYSVAEELRAHNIRVSVICPGSTNTDFSSHPGANPEKMLQASDVAHAVAMIVTQAPQSFMSEILLRPTQKP